MRRGPRLMPTAEARQFNQKYNQAVALVGYAWDLLGEVKASGEQLQKLNDIAKVLDRSISLLIELSPDKLRPRTRVRLQQRHEEQVA